jgi:hypothetical protein
VRVLSKLRPPAAGAAALVCLGLTPGAVAQAPVIPYDGHNPFNCTVQNTGTGVAYPDPAADPFCVEFDKTQQNVTDLGMLVFLSLEPARTLAAAPKCFYHQRDHWTASVIQGEEPEIYHWDGGYFFDKARGVGGAALTHFRVGGQAYDPRQLPLPPEFKTYFLADGGGGAVAWSGQQVDPSCVAKVDTPEEAARVYASSSPGGSPLDRCLPPRGHIAGPAVGSVRLGMTRTDVLRTLGSPPSELRGYQRYCLLDGSSLKVGYRNAEAGASGAARVRVLMTTSPAYPVRGVATGSSLERLRQRIPSAKPGLRMGGTVIHTSSRSPDRLLAFGVRHSRVVFLALADRRQASGRSALAGYLRRAR